MSAKQTKSVPSWVDPDDAPEWTEDQLARAEYAIGGKVIRPARGTLTKPRGRPKVDQPKESVTVRLDAYIVDALKSTGPRWQTRMNAMLRQAMKLKRAG